MVDRPVAPTTTPTTAAAAGQGGMSVNVRPYGTVPQVGPKTTTTTVTNTKTTRSGGDAMGAAGSTVSEGYASSTRNFATSRKVQKLLDITVNDNFRELVLYMNDAVPEFLENFLPPSADVSTVETDEDKLTPQKQRPPQQPQPVASISSSATLRTALEGRVLDLHRCFLREWSALNDVFEGVSDTVSKLHQESEVLQTTLNSHAERTKDFVSLMTTLQAELSLVQQREREIREFQDKYHFGAEEQEILNESPVDATYLDVLMSAQKTHRKCRELLLSREHYQSAASMMDITYLAIMKGTEKVARYLISASASMPGAMGFGGDSPEMTSFCLRCVNFLRDENISQWAAVVEEVARLRRAAVLRQYFHLMTTGSATTSAGTYRAGGKSREASATSGGTRPLEAEISNPIFFFSSLFAWLHQVIVDEEDFLGAFFPSTQPQGTSTAMPAGTASAEKDAVVAHTSKDEEETLLQGDVAVDAENSELPITKAAILDSIFEVLCKQIQGVLEGVLERFLRQASSLQEGDASAVGGAAAGGGGGGSGVLSGPSGPIGLTGGITRLLSAATGRVSSKAPSSSSGVQRYQHVMNRVQQEALVGATLVGFTNGLRTAHALLQLFTYYAHSTFIALLGREAALTRLVDDGKLQLLRVYHTIAKQLMDHSLDSVASVVSRCAVLRRLASADATTGVEEMNEGRSAVSCFVTNFLFLYASEEDLDADAVGLNDDRVKSLQMPEQSTQQISLAGGSVSVLGNRTVSNNPYHRSGLSKRQAQCVDLLRVMYSMILPTPPEVEECLRVLQATMVEAEKHLEVMESVQAMLSKNSKHVDSSAANAPPPCHEQFFTVLVQHVLSFPLLLARQTTVNNALDEPCKLALQLNTMSSLQETLAPHLSLLTLSSAAAGHSTPLSNVVPERIQQLTTELTTVLSQCAVKHYFCRRLQKNLSEGIAGGDDLGNSITINSVAVGEEFEQDCEQLDAPTISAQLHAFYGIVAASGRVYIPIIAAIRSPRLQEQITQNVLRALCDVYEVRYKRLVELQQQFTSTDADSTPAASPTPVSDIDPRKLRILLEVTPLPSTSA